MLSSKQCEIARVMTSDKTNDVKINEEFLKMSEEDKLSAAIAVDKILKPHNMPFDKGYKIMTNDFIHIATEFLVSPATMFCIYMECKSKELL